MTVHEDELHMRRLVELYILVELWIAELFREKVAVNIAVITRGSTIGERRAEEESLGSPAD